VEGICTDGPVPWEASELQCRGNSFGKVGRGGLLSNPRGNSRRQCDGHRRVKSWPNRAPATNRLSSANPSPSGVGPLQVL